MKILNRKLKPEQFIKHIHSLKVPFWRRVNKLVFHHTSSREDLWQGSASMLHYYNLYNSRGWTSGPHIFIAPDGIWLFTPIEEKGTHGGPEASKQSIGIEIVGRYYDEPPTNDIMCKYVALVTDLLKTKFNLEWEDIFNHIDFEEFSLCSPQITREWIWNNYVIHSDWVAQKYEDFHAAN